MSQYFAVYDAPFGAITPLVDGRGRLTALWTSDASDQLLARGIPRSEAQTEHVAIQMRAYFDRKLTDFDLPLNLIGTPFQLQIWEELQSIPYGQTTTYGDLARKIGNPESVRAVGRANATNPVAIVVPCHRVIGATGSLTGYAGGIDVKRKLLELESGSSSLF